MGDWLDLAGLARRAGQVLAGTEKVRAAVERGRVALVILAADLSPGSGEKMSALANSRGIPLLTGPERAVLGQALGCPGRAVFGVTSAAFARQIALSYSSRHRHPAIEGGAHHSNQ